MTNNNNLSDINNDIIQEIITTDINLLTPNQAINYVRHIQEQFRNRYRYLVGEWRGAHRAKNTTTGIFVSTQEVIDYLNNRIP
jgi:hypothetical protein